MSAEKKHDYHLVDPSPWPIYVSFSSLFLAIGTVYYLHSEVSWGMYLGFALLFYGTYMWFRDVVLESVDHDHHTPVVKIHLRYGMTLFIASEVMFFVAWFWAYFNASLFPSDLIGSVWPPKDIVTFDPWDIPLINTLILLLSGTTVTWAHHALEEGDRESFVQGLAMTVVLGFSFSLLQIYEYHHASFDFSGNIYGANFFMATGTFSANNNTSFPAKKASKSISPGCLKLLAPFIFNASVKIKPSKFNSFFNKSVTTA